MKRLLGTVQLHARIEFLKVELARVHVQLATQTKVADAWKRILEERDMVMTEIQEQLARVHAAVERTPCECVDEEVCLGCTISDVLGELR